MNPVEALTSESQERMLAIVTPENLDEVLALCERWEIRATVVGRVTDSGRFRVYDGYFDADRRARREPRARRWATIPRPSRRTTSRSRTCRSAASVTDRSITDRSRHPPTSPRARPRIRAPELLTRFPPGQDLSTELLDLLASPNIADKSWVWRQYDHQLFLNTVAGPGGDASVLRLKETAARRSRCRSTARAGSARSTRGSARSSRCSRRRATSRAAAPDRSRW